MPPSSPLIIFSRCVDEYSNAPVNRYLLSFDLVFTVKKKKERKEERKKYKNEFNKSRMCQLFIVDKFQSRLLVQENEIFISITFSTRNKLPKKSFLVGELTHHIPCSVAYAV